MSFASPQDLVAFGKANPDSFIWTYGNNETSRSQTPAREINTLKKAAGVIRDAKQATLERRQRKVNRPWELVALTEKLDPNQPWIGVEYETGFRTDVDYKKVINHVWDNFLYSAIDLEGYGTYCPEITFSPQNFDKFMNKTADIYSLLQWMDKSAIKMAAFPSGSMIGTHFNISTPNSRKGSYEKLLNTVKLLNTSIVSITVNEATALYGRTPYGLGYVMGSPGSYPYTPDYMTKGGGAAKCWVEFKLFNSTDKLSMFDNYVNTATKLIELIDMCCSSDFVLPVDNSYIYNLSDILSGTTPVEKAIILPMTKEHYQAYSGGRWRFNNMLSEHRDADTQKHFPAETATAAAA